MFLSIGGWLADQTFLAAIGFGLLAGLLGAFGRARDDGKRPDRNWLVNRLLIMPFLGTVAATLGQTALSGLPIVVTTFVAMVLSLAAYDALRVIERDSLRRLGNLLSGDPATPSIDVAHRPTVSPEQHRDNPPAVRPIETLRDVVPLLPNTPEEAAMLDKLTDD